MFSHILIMKCFRFTYKIKMSSNDSYEDSEHLVKKPRLDSGGDQDVPMTMAAVTDGIVPQVQNEAVTTDSSPTIQASYSFTITNGLYMYTVYKFISINVCLKKTCHQNY